MGKSSIIGTLGNKLFPQSCAAVIVAGGSSQRMAGVDKVLAHIAGKPVILRVCEAFEQNSLIKEIVVVARQDIREEIKTLLEQGGITKLKAVVDGGASRTESVNRGVNWCSKNTGLIAVHDAARPLVPQSVITETVTMAGKFKAAAPAMPVRDTIGVVKNGILVDSPDRSTLYAMQTPQVFDADLLRAALTHVLSKKLPVTDECSALETLGMHSYITKGHEMNFKITTGLDLTLANLLAGKDEA